jgi:hypothetical protein
MQTHGKTESLTPHVIVRRSIGTFVRRNPRPAQAKKISGPISATGKYAEPSENQTVSLMKKNASA